MDCYICKFGADVKISVQIIHFVAKIVLAVAIDLELLKCTGDSDNSILA